MTKRTHELTMQELELELKRAELEEKNIQIEIASHIEQEKFNRNKEATRVHKLKEHMAANRTLHLNGDVDDSMLHHADDTLRYWERENDVDNKPPGRVEVVLDTHGGSVTDGLAIIDLIREYQNKGWTIDTRVMGTAFSMGAVILQAGATRSMSPHSTFMIHEISSMVWGKASDIKDRQAYMEKLEELTLNLLSERSNYTADEVRAIQDRKDVFMNAAETLEHGFVDEIR